jgi:hypothetical protein
MVEKWSKQMKRLKEIFSLTCLILLIAFVIGYYFEKPEQAIAQPLPPVGNQYLEFRATQSSTAAFYPSAAALTLRGYEICIANDDDDTSLYCRTDGTIADVSEANCDTVGCKTMEIKFGEKICRPMIVTRLSCDAAANVAFRAWVGQRGGL